jgi:hypothetical protein
MNNCKKTIKQSDITTTPIKLKYSSSYYSSTSTPQFPEHFTDIYGYQVNGNAGSALNGPFNTSLGGDIGLYQDTGVLLYKSIKQLYYQNHLTGSLLDSASYWDWNQQSTACSGSSEYEYRYFPTSSNDYIGFITISHKKFGEQISRSTFVMRPETPNNYLIHDDGNGNLIDVVNNNVHIGNIIYSQGLIIITNTDYLGILISQ